MQRKLYTLSGGTKCGWTLSLCLIIIATGIVSCVKEPQPGNPYSRVKPSGPPPAWAPGIQPQMLAVIEALDSIARPIHTLTVEEARQQPSPADAVKLVMQKFNIPMPPMKVDTSGREIAVEKGTIHARLYTPKTGKSKYPVIVYFHGGGWVIATIDTYDASAQALAEKTDAIVVSVEYRKGPEFKFPTAHYNAFAAYRWVLHNAPTFKGDSTRIAVAGESAGGNMAITVSMMARDSSIRMPVHQLSVYPVASSDMNTPSKLKYVDALPLSTPDLPWFLSYYLNSMAEADDPLISLVNANLENLPPTTVIAAEIDPLQSEGKQLTEKLEQAGNAITYRLYEGVTHEFFGMAAVVPEAKAAQDLAAQNLKKAFR